MKKKLFLLIFFLSLLPLVDYFRPGLPLTHDGADHVARIANFYQSLSEGNLMPRWAANLNWGFGHPILMFLYPLPSYIASVFRFTGMSLVDSTKAVFVITYVASILAMYFWAGRRWGDAAGAAAAVLYGFAPYRFVDLYVRGALGEHVAFVFPPLILLGIDLIADRQKKHEKLWGSMLVSTAIAGLILSHNAVSLMFMPLVVLYLLVAAPKSASKRSFWVEAVLAIGLGFMISAFFWVPALFEGKYTLRDIVTRDPLTDRFVPLTWFIKSAWNYGGGDEFSKELGVAQWIFLISAFVILVRGIKRELSKLLILFLAFTVISAVAMTRYSSLIWNNIALLRKFQFPWRLLALTTFTTSAIGAIIVASLSKFPKKVVLGGTLFVILITTSSMWKAKSYIFFPEAYYQGIYRSTTDTGESSPIWSVRFMERIAEAPLTVIEGTVNYTVTKRTTTHHEYVLVAKEKSRLAENTLYFPGWRVALDGQPLEVEFQDPNYRGLMTFWVEAGEHLLDVKFSDTKLRAAASLLGLTGIILVALQATIPLWKKPK